MAARNGNPENSAAPDFSKVASLMEEKYPRLWRVCYPRIYRESFGERYASARRVATLIALIAVEYHKGNQATCQQYEFFFANHVTRLRNPMYWLSEGLAEALRATRSNLPIPWWTLPLPVDAGMLMLPRGTLVHAEEGDVLFVGWARLQPGVVYKSPLFPDTSYEMTNGGLILIAATEAGFMTHWNIPLDQTPETITLQYLEQKFPDSPIHEGGEVLAPYAPTSADGAMLVGTAHYLFMTFMALSARPALLNPGKLEKQVHHKGTDLREYWTPNVLGEGYRMRQQASETRGEHRSPRLHLVSGFWREQAHGAGRSLRRQQWIEPFWRGQ